MTLDIGNGILTNEHAASNYGQPVFVFGGRAYGPADRLPNEYFGSDSVMAFFSEPACQTVGAAARDGSLEILAVNARAVLPRLLEAVHGAGVAVKGVDLVEPDLEAVFLHLTGKALRDAGG